MFDPLEILQCLQPEKHLEGKSTDKLSVRIDSRNIWDPTHSIFIAIKGARFDGHDFIPDLLKRSIAAIVCEKIEDHWKSFGCHIFQVKDTTIALQQLAQYHRKKFDYPVIGITGSNGKTTVKEWLAHFLSDQYSIVKSPGSYNSQIGVPLSLFGMTGHHNLGIFEAGISHPGEMKSLADMIVPGIGIFTHLGDAHELHFKSRQKKFEEKIKLFAFCHTIICRKDEHEIHRILKERYPKKTIIGWSGRDDETRWQFHWKFNHRGCQLSANLDGVFLELNTTFKDEGSIENLCHVLCTCHILGADLSRFQSNLNSLPGLAMRMEQIRGISDTLLINDSYNADVEGLKKALDHLSRYPKKRSRVLVLAPFPQVRMDRDKMEDLGRHIVSAGIRQIINLYGEWSGLKDLLKHQISWLDLPDKKALQDQFLKLNLASRLILIKGGRQFRLENLVGALSLQNHRTVLEIDLPSLSHNLLEIAKYLNPDTRLMVMVKAQAYGSGNVELAHFLESQNVHYLCVAFADEGIKLRKSGIELPILVLNPNPEGFAQMIHHRLEAEIYRLEDLRFIATLASDLGKTASVHIKLDTGMNRLGFREESVHELVEIIQNSPSLNVVSVFTHLASVSNPEDDEFTKTQMSRYLKMVDLIWKMTGLPILRHVLNSAGILRFPEWQFDMVRLGIAMYGIGLSDENKSGLLPVHRLKTRISQIRWIDEGETVSYNRNYTAKGKRKIGILPLGYADGIMRMAGNGHFEVWIRGKLYPVIGDICMDMMMVELTQAEDVEEGDEVIIFGPEHSIEHLAAACKTISYEVISRISERVKRVYLWDS